MEATPKSILDVIAPFTPLVTPATILILVWRARGWVDKFTASITEVKENHLPHLQASMDQTQKAVKEQTAELKTSLEKQTEIMGAEFREQRTLLTNLAILRK